MGGGRNFFEDNNNKKRQDSSPYEQFITQSADEFELDPDLIRAMMYQESRFKPTARSSKGASGLMQLMPATAQRFGVTDIYDPKQNIRAGAKYMRWLLDRFDGNVDLALAGYNAGEGAVDKYGRKIPPYQETQNYVKNIRSRYQGTGYRRLRNFFDGTQPTQDFFNGVPQPIEQPKVRNFFDIQPEIINQPTQNDGLTDVTRQTGGIITPQDQAVQPTQNNVIQQPQTVNQPIQTTRNFFDTETPQIETLGGIGQGVFPEQKAQTPQTLGALNEADLLQFDDKVRPQTTPKPTPQVPVWLADKTKGVTPLPNETEQDKVFAQAYQNQLQTYGLTDSEALRQKAIQNYRAGKRIFSDEELNALDLYKNNQLVNAPTGQQTKVDGNQAFQNQTKSVQTSTPQNTVELPTFWANVDPDTIEGDQTAKNEGVFRQAVKQAGKAIYGRELNAVEVSFLTEYQRQKSGGFVFENETEKPLDAAKGEYRVTNLGEYKNYLDQNRDKITETQEKALAEFIGAGVFQSFDELDGATQNRLRDLGFTDDELRGAFTGASSRLGDDNPRMKAARDAMKQKRAQYDAYYQQFLEESGGDKVIADAKARMTMNWIDEETFNRTIGQNQANKLLEKGDYKGYLTELRANNLISGEEFDRELEAADRLESDIQNEGGQQYVQGGEFGGYTRIDLTPKQIKERFGARVQEIKATYGKLANYYAVVDREARLTREAWKKVASSPGAVVTEFTKNIIRAVPEAVSSLSKAVSIGAEALETAVTGQSTPANQKAFYNAGQWIDRQVEEWLPQDALLRRNFIATVLPNTLGQVGVQFLAGWATGLARVPVALGVTQGGSQAYEEAEKAGATRNQKLGAFFVGGLAAVPDAIPFAKWMKTLPTAGKLGFIGRFFEGFTAKAVKEFGEENAKKAAIRFAQNFVVNGGLEGLQEVSEDVINNWYASATYDKKRQVFTLDGQTFETFLAGFLGGGVAGTAIETAVEKAQWTKQNDLALANEYGRRAEIDVNQVENAAKQASKTVGTLPQKQEVSANTRRQQVNQLLELGYDAKEIDAISQADVKVITDNKIAPNVWNQLSEEARQNLTEENQTDATEQPKKVKKLAEFDENGQGVFQTQQKINVTNEKTDVQKPSAPVVAQNNVSANVAENQEKVEQRQRVRGFVPEPKRNKTIDVQATSQNVSETNSSLPKTKVETAKQPKTANILQTVAQPDNSPVKVGDMIYNANTLLMGRVVKDFYNDKDRMLTVKSTHSGDTHDILFKSAQKMESSNATIEDFQKLAREKSYEDFNNIILSSTALLNRLREFDIQSALTFWEQTTGKTFESAPKVDRWGNSNQQSAISSQTADVVKNATSETPKESKVSDEPKVAESKVKEPYEMTRKEFVDSEVAKDFSPVQQNSTKRIMPKFHKQSVESALKEGKTVPPEVLADYPDLAKKYGKTPTKESPTATRGKSLPENAKDIPQEKESAKVDKSDEKTKQPTFNEFLKEKGYGDRWYLSNRPISRYDEVGSTRISKKKFAELEAEYKKVKEKSIAKSEKDFSATNEKESAKPDFEQGEPLTLRDGTEVVFLSDEGNGKIKVVDDGQKRVVALSAVRTDAPLRSVPRESEINLENLYDEKGNVNYEKTSNVADRIRSGSLAIERLDSQSEQGRIRGGQRNVEASLILAGSERAVQKASSGNRTGLQNSHSDTVKRQERILEQYAKHEGIWFKQGHFPVRLYLGRGGEALVYQKDENRVVKLIDYRHIDKSLTPQKFLDNRISLFNALFPATHYELMGFMRDEQGKFRVIVTQPLIRGNSVINQGDIDAVMNDRGFERTGRDSYSNSLYQVHDLHAGNALNADGTILVIDAVPKFNTEAKPFRVVENSQDQPLRSVPREMAKVSDIGFYSAIEQAILDKMPNRASSEQIKGLLNPQKTAGIKQEELDWLGIGEFLSEKDTFTRNEVLEFIRANQVDVQEVLKGEVSKQIVINTEEGEHTLELRNRNEETYPYQWYDITDDNWVEGEVFETVNEGLRYAEMAWNNDVFGIKHYSSETKFSQYQLEGEKENYREVLLTMPEKEVNIPQFVDNNASYVIEAFKKSGKLKVVC